MRSHNLFWITTILVLFAIYGLVVVPVFDIAFKQNDIQQGALLAFFSLPFFLSLSMMETAGTYREWDNPFEQLHYFANYVYAAFFVLVLVYALVYRLEQLIGLF